MLSTDGINKLEAENEHFKKMWKDTQKQLDIAGKAIVEMVEKNDKLKAENKSLQRG